MSDEPTDIQCPACAANGKDTGGDNLRVFDNGWKYCIACEYKEAPDGDTPKERKQEVAGDLIKDVGVPEAIPSRRLTLETCRKYGITSNRGWAVFPGLNADGILVSQKTMGIHKKKIKQYGDPKDVVLFGRHLFKAGGPRVVVTEGEWDAPSLYQVLCTKSEWPVVSITKGASNNDDATKVVNEIRRNFDWLNSFDEVVFCFDNDEAGQKSAKAAAALFPPGKAYVTALTLNDPSDYLQANKTKELYKEVWGSPSWRPDGIVSVDSVDISLDIGDVLTYSSRKMTAKMLGRKLGTMSLVVSGTGSGKTTWVREELLHDVRNGTSVGCMFLEETPRDTLLELAGMEMGIPVRRILTQRALQQIDPKIPAEFKDNLDDTVLAQVVGEIKKKPINLYDHFGSAKASDILSNIEYMVTGLGCKAIILDHLSLVQVEVDDIRGLENFVKELQHMTKRLDAHFFIISQLSQSEGNKSYEEGKMPSIKNIRGSQMIPACMDEILSLTRNQQAEDEEDRNIVNIHSLKGRLGAHTGLIETRRYDKQTGRLYLTDTNYEDSFVDETANPQIMETLS